MISFNIAAEAAPQVVSDKTVTAVINGVEYEARPFSAGQLAMLNVDIASGSMSQQTNGLLHFIEIVLGEEVRDIIADALRVGTIDMEDVLGGSEQNPDGLIGAIVSEFSGRPTKPSSGSSSKPQPGGRRSTGRAPGKGSTRSSSAPTDS